MYNITQIISSLKIGFFTNITWSSSMFLQWRKNLSRTFLNFPTPAAEFSDFLIISTFLLEWNWIQVSFKCLNFCAKIQKVWMASVLLRYIFLKTNNRSVGLRSPSLRFTYCNWFGHFSSHRFDSRNHLVAINLGVNTIQHSTAEDNYQ